MAQEKRSALVTGAARGIGLATARLLSARGWNVAMLDRDAEALAGAVASVPGALELVYDVSDPQASGRMIDAVTSAFGGLHGLVNNAGVADFGPIEDTSFERWRTVMATNLDGVFLVSQAAIGALRASGSGAIVNIASISGLRASTLRVAYGTSKAGVIQLTLQQAVELGEYNIRANAICPGPVRTKLAMAVHTQDIIDAYHDAIPLNRYGSVQEVAQAICFLLSPEASYITGQVLSADGGFEATGVGLPALRSP